MPIAIIRPTSTNSEKPPCWWIAASRSAEAAGRRESKAIPLIASCSLICIAIISGGYSCSCKGFGWKNAASRCPFICRPTASSPFARCWTWRIWCLSCCTSAWRWNPGRPGSPSPKAKCASPPYPTTHLEGLRQQLQAKYPGQYAAYCFLLEHAGHRIGHSADLGAPSDLAPLLLHPLDLLVCELSHFTIPEICNYLRGRPIKKVLFTHLSRHCWEDFEGTRREVTRLLPGMNVVFAWDGDVVML